MGLYPVRKQHYKKKFKLFKKEHGKRPTLSNGVYPVRKNSPFLSNGVYVILDREFLGRREILKTAKSAILAGADIIQLRDKSSSISEMIKVARRLKTVAKRYKVPFIINDRIDVALAVDAHGLHIGRTDIGPLLARRLIGNKKTLGVSVKDIDGARRAMAQGADYIGVGPIFKTPIKKDKRPKGFGLIGRLKKIKIPFFCIGGIGLKNVRRLAGRGFKDIAVIRAVCNSPNPYAATKRLKEALT